MFISDTITDFLELKDKTSTNIVSMTWYEVDSHMNLKLLCNSKYCLL